MPRFDVLLASQTDQQSRRVTLEAPSEGHARAQVMAQEAKVVSFSLLPPAPVKPEPPKLHLPASATVGAATVYADAWESYEGALQTYENALETYPGRLSEAEKYLAELNDTYSADPRGKVLGPKGRARAHWHGHHQSSLYVIKAIEQVEIPRIEIDRLLEELRYLQGDEEAWNDLLRRLRESGSDLAVVTAGMYGVPAKNQYDGTAVVNWTTDTIKTMMTTVTYVVDIDTHDFQNDITNEVTGTGYTAGGNTLGTKTSTYDTATDQARLGAANTSWTTSTITARRAVNYKSTGTSTTSPVMSFVDFGADVISTGGTFQITWDATGIIVIDVT